MYRIYYDDGSTYDGDPVLAPGWGVVVIPQDDLEVGRMMMASWDHYCWHGYQWWGHDLVGLMDCLALPGRNIVIHGRTVPQDTYQRIYTLALNDPDFTPKSAKAPLERRGG